MKLTFNKTRFLALSFGFIIFTVIGTLSHEFGHYIVAKLLGYEAQIRYAYTSIRETPNQATREYDNLLFILGGPVQTIFTGISGLVFLLLKRKAYQSAQELSWNQWFWVFITFFLSRQTANLLSAIIPWFRLGYWPVSGGDEGNLDYYFDFPDGTILMSTGLISTVILIVVVFRFIPLKERFTFIMSGLIGCVSGFIIWMYWLGKMVLP
jgi:hypothetical protein